MLHTTNMVLLVGAKDYGEFSPRKVTIWSTSDNSVICSFWPFNNPILMAKINKRRLIVCEKTSMHIYSTEDMRILHTIEVGNLQEGRLALSVSSEKNNYVCYSSHSDEGIVKVYDLLYLTFKNSITAHKTPIMRMVLNIKGDLLATCSCKGTMIRIFSLPKGEKIITLKRGMSYANVLSMNFSTNSEMFILSSDTGTIHFFLLNQKDSCTSYVSNFFQNLSTKIIPKEYEDVISVTRSQVSYNSNVLKVSNIVSLNPNNINEAFMFNSNGVYCLLAINYEDRLVSKISESQISQLKLII